MADCTTAVINVEANRLKRYGAGSGKPLGGVLASWGAASSAPT
jgi:hypothetical protein